jgi:chromosome segregation ATPase
LSRDVLEEILSAALHENAIAQHRLADFAAGLRDRARLILEERVRPLQDRVESLEKENGWRAASIDNLTLNNERVSGENERLKDENRRVKEENGRIRGEMWLVKDENRRVKDENALVREEHKHLVAEVAQLKHESRRLQDENRRLKEEMDAVRAEWRTASAAHDRLLEHHRGVIRGAAESLGAVADLPMWRRGQARAHLADIAAALRRDTA